MKKPLTLADYPPDLQRAYSDRDGDIMWRAGIARAATILIGGEMQQLLDAVRDMRAAQKAFFKNRQRDDLDRSRKLEREVDELIKRIDNPQGGLL